MAKTKIGKPEVKKAVETPANPEQVKAKANKAKEFLKSMIGSKKKKVDYEILENVIVRFDVGQSQWAILEQQGDELVPKRHFEFGALYNVELVAKEESTETYTCAGTRTSKAWAGIAKAQRLELLSNGSNDLAGFQNLRFDTDKGSFLTAKGKVVSSAQEIKLMPNRSAMYR